MSNDLDFWTAIVSDVPATAVERLCMLIDFSDPPDFVKFVRDQHRARQEQDLTNVWSILLDTGVLGRGVVAVDHVSLADAVDLSKLALSYDQNFDTRLMRQLLSNRTWPEEIPYEEAMRTLEIVEALGLCERQVMTLLKFVQYPHPFIQSKVAKLLGRCCDSMKVIKELSGHPDKRVRANLVEGIGCRNDISSYTQLLKAAASDQDIRLSTLALAILAGRGDRLSAALLRIRMMSKIDEISVLVHFLTDRAAQNRNSATVGLAGKGE